MKSRDLKKDEHLIELFIQESNKHYKNTIESNTRKTNKAADILFNIWKLLKTDEEYARYFIDELINSITLESKGFISAIALDMNYRVEDAKVELIRTMKTHEEPLIRFNAEMTLKTWEKQGWLFRG